jgi:hypothetical protein
MTQKFKRGDLVMIAKDLGSSMQHFTADCRAIVIASYNEQFGGGAGDGEHTYTVFVEGKGETAWYYESQLTLIEHNPALLQTWLEHAEARKRDHTNLKWIIDHWDQALKISNANIILTVMEAMEFDSAFNRNGEYYVLWNDWDNMLPVANTLVAAKTIDELRARQKPDADPEIVADMERWWHRLHA